jgi:hypothetical protein
MSDKVLALIISAIGLIGALLGYGASFLEQRWRLKQTREADEWKHRQLRIDALLEPRRRVYSEGLQFVYEAERNQYNPQSLAQILDRWKTWHPQNAIYLPPSVNNALFSAMNWTHAIYVDLSNRRPALLISVQVLC